MSVHYTIDSAQRTITVIGSGDLNRSMLESMFDTLMNDAAFDPTFDTVADFSAVAYLDLNLVDIQMLAENSMHRKVRLLGMRLGRFAIITGMDQGRYSLGVYFKTLAAGVNETRQRIFRTADEARAWLGTAATA